MTDTTPDTVRKIEARIMEILKAEFGDRVASAGGTFETTHATLRIKVRLSESKEGHDAGVRAQFATYTAMWGLTAAD